MSGRSLRRCDWVGGWGARRKAGVVEGQALNRRRRGHCWDADRLLRRRPCRPLCQRLCRRIRTRQRQNHTTIRPSARRPQQFSRAYGGCGSLHCGLKGAKHHRPNIRRRFVWYSCRRLPLAGRALRLPGALGDGSVVPQLCRPWDGSPLQPRRSLSSRLHSRSSLNRALQRQSCSTCSLRRSRESRLVCALDSEAILNSLSDKAAVRCLLSHEANARIR